jgi:hypothetical protein
VYSIPVHIVQVQVQVCFTWEWPSPEQTVTTHPVEPSWHWQAATYDMRQHSCQPNVESTSTQGALLSVLFFAQHTQMGKLCPMCKPSWHVPTKLGVRDSHANICGAVKKVQIACSQNKRHERQCAGGCNLLLRCALLEQARVTTSMKHGTAQHSTPYASKPTNCTRARVRQLHPQSITAIGCPGAMLRHSDQATLPATQCVEALICLWTEEFDKSAHNKHSSDGERPSSIYMDKH